MAILPDDVRTLLGVAGITAQQGGDGVNAVVLPNGANYYDAQGGLDVITGGSGNDYIEGGAGIDTLAGGGGFNDTLGYFNSPAGRDGVSGVTVTLNGLGGALLSTGGHAAGDLVASGFENLVGSQFNDVLTGNASANKLVGMGGNDTLNGMGGDDILVGGAGGDQLNGGAGTDTANYSTSGGGITVDLATHVGSGGDAQGDRLNSIEKVIGSNFSDSITGDHDEKIIGGAGADIMTASVRNIFVYESESDSTPSAPDFITFTVVNNLEISGKIDLQLIDAIQNTAGFNDTFTFIGDSPITAAGQLRTGFDGAGYFVEGNLNNDLAPDFRINYFSDGGDTLAAANFIL